jgi:hypothetical protein
MESGGYNISRLSSFSTINRIFFKNNVLLNLFGYGLGNCDTSNIGMLNTQFYTKYGWLHYTWFSHQQWFLEGGYSCVICLVMFFVMYCWYALKNKNILKEYEELSVFICTFSIMLIINLWYNNSIRLECSYIAFSCLALLPSAIRDKVGNGGIYDS